MASVLSIRTLTSLTHSTIYTFCHGREDPTWSDRVDSAARNYTGYLCKIAVSLVNSGTRSGSIFVPFLRVRMNPYMSALFDDE